MDAEKKISGAKALAGRDDNHNEGSVGHTGR